MRLKRLLILSCTFLALIQAASALEPERAGQENFLTRAVYVDGHLWVLSDAGVLSSLVEGEQTWVRSSLDEPVYDICATQGELLAVAGKREGARQWTMHRWRAGTWTTENDIPAIDERPLALNCMPGEVTLLTSSRLIDVNGKVPDVFWTSQGVHGRITSFYAIPGALLMGTNAGEWGGGLHRIDRATGEVTSIERNISGNLCGGPLNRECDPVNGIATVPWKPECAAVAIGLVHMRGHGRIVEVCGENVSRLYYSADPQAVPTQSGDEPFETVPFFGLAGSPDAIWAFGDDKLYRIEENGTATTVAIPPFRKIGNIEVSFALPDFVLVLTDVNQRRSLSGSTPILVPR